MQQDDHSDSSGDNTEPQDARQRPKRVYCNLDMRKDAVIRQDKAERKAAKKAKRFELLSEYKASVAAARARGEVDPPMPEELKNKKRPGRDQTGKFLPGNKGGPGNTQMSISERTQLLRRTVAKCTTPNEIKRIWRRTIQAAEAGEEWAIKEVLNRIMGKPAQSVEIEHTGLPQMSDADRRNQINLLITGGAAVTQMPELIDMTNLPIEGDDEDEQKELPGA